jgi:hypothetical protein
MEDSFRSRREIFSGNEECGHGGNMQVGEEARSETSHNSEEKDTAPILWDSLKHQMLGISSEESITEEQETEFSTILDTTQGRIDIANYLRETRARMGLDESSTMNRTASTNNGGDEFGDSVPSLGNTTIQWVDNLERRMREGELNAEQFNAWSASLIDNLEKSTVEGNRDGNVEYGNMLDDEGNPIMDDEPKYTKAEQEEENPDDGDTVMGGMGDGADGGEQ